MCMCNMFLFRKKQNYICVYHHKICILFSSWKVSSEMMDLVIKYKVMGGRLPKLGLILLASMNHVV